MRLGIISDCVHYLDSAGKPSTENHIFLRQMEALCSKFSEAVICCPFDVPDQQKVLTSYTNPSISFIQLPNVGGNTVKAKLRVLSTLFSWFKAFKQVDKRSDVVYQRFPNNLNLPGFFYFFLKRKNVFATYTGTWAGYEGEPITYSFQRWLLQKFFRGPVWVYADGANNNQRLHNGFSPSYSTAEWHEESSQVQMRIERLLQNGLPVLRMITVGTLIDYKNQIEILKACVHLREVGIPFNLTVVGDGPMRQDLSKFIVDNNLEAEVKLVGKKNHTALRELYRQHDLVVQAPLSEGFGKVPIEGYFHGLVPCINNIAMASAITGHGQRGYLFKATEPNALGGLLKAVFDDPTKLPAMIENGRDFARTQTLEAWAQQYFETINQHFAKG